MGDTGDWQKLVEHDQLDEVQRRDDQLKGVAAGTSDESDTVPPKQQEDWGPDHREQQCWFDPGTYTQQEDWGPRDSEQQRWFDPDTFQADPDLRAEPPAAPPCLQHLTHGAPVSPHGSTDGQGLHHHQPKIVSHDLQLRPVTSQPATAAAAGVPAVPPAGQSMYSGQWGQEVSDGPPVGRAFLTITTIVAVLSICCCICTGVAAIVTAVQAGQLKEDGRNKESRSKLQCTWALIILSVFLAVPTVVLTALGYNYTGNTQTQAGQTYTP